MVGGVVGLFVGVPIPIVGPIVGVVLLTGVGALVGALLGERWKGRNLGDSWKVGKAAFWGRLLGTVAKTVIGAVMAGTTIVALIA